MLGICGLLMTTGVPAWGWNALDLSNGTNYVASPGGYTNNVYFSSYFVTNNSTTIYSNIWVRMGTFTNGTGPANIGLGGGSLNKKSLGLINAFGSSPFYFCLSGTNSTTSATNTIGVYNGDPDNGGVLLTNILFTKNYVILVTVSANGGVGGTNYLSTHSPILGGFLTITSTYTLGNNSTKPGLYASYPAVSNNWDASTFSLVTNSFIVDSTVFTNQTVGNITYSKAATMTNIATFRIINAKATTTVISAGGFVNTGGGATPNYILPGNAGALSPIPPPTNSLVLTNWASAPVAYTNTLVYFTNELSNSGSDDATVAGVICKLPAGFIYAGSPTYNGVQIDNPATNSVSATNYVLSFSQGYLVPALSRASLVFAAIPTNTVDAGGNLTNRTVLATYSAYGLVGTNHIDLTYDTGDNATPATSLQVLLEPTAVDDAYSVNEDTQLNVAAPGVLGNDGELNGFTLSVISYTQPAHGSVNVNDDGSFTYLGETNYFGADSFTYTMTNGNARASTATVSLTINAVNDPPTLNAIGNLFTNEGSGTVVVDLTGITAGPANESSQTLSVSATSSNPTLIPNPVLNYASPATTGTLQLTPAANQFGTATITVVVQDNGGVANGGVDSITNTFDVIIYAINVAPSFTIGADQSVREDSGPQTVPNWATSISTGPTNESGQILTFHLDNNNNTLFAVQPTVSASGTLTYTPATNANGTATVTIYLQDNGGTANGGSDTSPTNTFVINVTAVNDPPTLNSLTNLYLVEGAGQQTINLSSITAGPPDEASQTLNVSAFSDDRGIIPDPTVNYTSPDATGTLIFTPVTGALGTATLSVLVQDNGSTTNGGINAVTNTFTVTILPKTNVWNGGDSFALNVNNASGPAGTGYTQTNYIGYLNLLADSNNPIAINLASLNGGSAGPAANFDFDTGYAWTIAATTRGILNFDPAQFVVDTSAFENDLAGGIFNVTTNGTNLVVAFLPNHPPVMQPLALGRAWGTAMRIPIAFVLTNATSDPDNDPTAIDSLGSSTNGTFISTNAALIFFAPTNNFTESFNCVIRDVRNYRPGDTVRTATNWITVTVTNAIGSAVSVVPNGGALNIQFAGIPNFAYDVERATDINGPWQVLQTTNAPSIGIWIFTDNSPPQPAAFYRLRQH